jgi:hypothetical protein
LHDPKSAAEFVEKNLDAAAVHFLDLAKNSAGNLVLLGQID